MSPIRAAAPRFVDEVHVPGLIEGPTSWAAYVDPAYLGLTGLLDAEVTEVVGGLSARISDHNQVNVRYGTLDGGRALNTDGPLTLRSRPETPGFLLDTDAFHAAASPEALVLDDVLTIADVLQNCAEHVFLRTFTDAARDIFRTDGDS